MQQEVSLYLLKYYFHKLFIKIYKDPDSHSIKGMESDQPPELCASASCSPVYVVCQSVARSHGS